MRDSLNDLRGIMASPALWASGEPPQIVRTSLDALFGIAEELEQRVAQRTRELAVANEALRDSERESRLILDSIPGLIAAFTPGGELEFANRPIFEYFGKTFQELQRWAADDTVHPEDNPRVVEVFAGSITSGDPFHVELRARRFDGAYRWFQSRGFPLRDRNGQITRWYNLLIDIDERKRAEEAFAASERDLRLIIGTIPALAWSARPDGSAEFFNQHYLDFIGLSAEEASGWGWTAAVHREDANGLAATWQRIMASEAQGEAEARLRRHDGEYRWFLFRASPLRDENGSIVKWYGVNTDIEDRKRAEQELQRSEARKTAILDSALDCILTIDHEGHNTEFNQIRRAQRAVSDFEYELRIVVPDHSIKYLHLIAHGSQDENGRLEYIGAIQDVTQRRLAEEGLSKARAALTHVSRVTTLGTLTASIAHEVNQPLSGIITNAGTCLRMLDADPPNVDGARETARRTIRDGNRAADVIARLRVLFSNKEFTLEPVDLNEATREVIALSVGDLQRHRVVLQSELADDLPVVPGDRVQLQQVILNLLRNASDAMVDVHDRPRQLLIRTEREKGDRVRLTVRDAGVGLDSQNIDKLFDTFYTTKTDGMGIGLSISRSIIETHQGRLWAEPNDGPGATFAFSIPVEP